MSEEGSTTTTTTPSKDKDIRIRIRGKIVTIPKVINIYMRSLPYPHIYTKLIEILAREYGGFPNLTDWFWKQAEEYVRVHAIGNPQRMINGYLEPEPTTCDNPDCDDLAEWQVRFSGRKYVSKVCTIHFSDLKRESKRTGIPYSHRRLKHD